MEMNVSQSNYSGGKVFSFEASADLIASGETPAIIIPDIQGCVTITVTPAGGASVSVYSTTSPVEIIKNDYSNVVWIEWAAGVVTEAMASAFHPISAIKMIQTGAGSSKITLRAQ